MITVDSITSTSIQVSWNTPCPEVDRYEILWERDISRECYDEKLFYSTIVSDSTTYNITELEENSHYTITVIAYKAGFTSNNTVVGMTAEAGKRHVHVHMVWYP